MPAFLASALPSGASLGSHLARLVRTWSYNGERRDARLDLLRGFAALAMIVDHVGGGDSWLYLLSGGDRFFVSAAEGFVFISGLVMGIVYAGVIARQGLRAALRKGARRVATLYALTVGLSLSFAVLSWLLQLPWTPQLGSGGWVAFTADLLTLHRAYYLTDVLLLYTFVIAAALPVLVLLRRGYTGWVLAGSWALWAAWQWWPDALRLPWPITDSNTFQFSAWQALFLTGLVIGYHRRALEARLAGWGARARTALRLGALVGAGAVVGGSIALYGWYQAHTSDMALGGLLGQLFGKADLRAGRLALFGCLFVLLYLITTRLWGPIQRVAGWLLPLGRDALSVYALHLFAVALLIAAAPWLPGGAAASQFDNTLRQGAVILLLWGVVRVKPQGGALRAFAARRMPGWVRVPGGLRGRMVLPPPPVAGVNALHRLAGSRALQGGLAVLVLAGLLLGPDAPALAAALKRGFSPTVTRLADDQTGPDADTAAAPTPTSGPRLQAQTNADFNMLVSGTAIPGVIPTPSNPTLPPYVEQHTFQSTSLDRAMPYYIYLPPAYANDPTVRYPVLYMLHGMSGSYDEWLGYGLLGRARDMMIAGQIAPFLIVVPQGDQSYWVDHADGGPRWGSYVVQDLVSEIDAHFRTLADRQYRAIGGLSMGGYGALDLAINYPDVFGIAGAHSPSLHGKADAPAFLGDQSYFDLHDPVYLYQTHPDIARTLQIYLDVGQADPWLPAIAAFHQLLVTQGIPHEWHAFPGDHDGVYWSTHVIDYLLFYSRALTSRATATATPAASPVVSPTLTPTPVPPTPTLPATPTLPMPSALPAATPPPPVPGPGLRWRALRAD